ncbi:hypothetical protein [Lysobacter capsici]|uniref:hypothetical protein n=1 Tax=Lysobacter capsici TaxID=435897 RepID=UPI001C000F18|nr:hypothetical protein [Lysobacter capsici]QWF17251.1 hypothetical protein KME82_00120 [Lysobacter capsici]
MSATPNLIRIRSIVRARAASIALCLSLCGVAQAAAPAATAAAFDGYWQTCERYQGEEYCESLQLSQQGETIRAAWNWRASQTGGTDLLIGRIEDGRAVFDAPGCEVTSDSECRPKQQARPQLMVLLRCGRDLYWVHDRKRSCAQVKPSESYRRVDRKALSADVVDFAGYDFFRQP